MDNIQRHGTEKFNDDADTVVMFVQARTREGGRAKVDIYVRWDEAEQKFEVVPKQYVSV